MTCQYCCKNKFTIAPLLTLASLILLFSLAGVTYAGDLLIKMSANGLELADDATEWSCVKNNVTGQVWEKKVQSNKDDTYTLDGTVSDVSFFVNKINDTALCGYTNWRLPSLKELNSITDKTIQATASAGVVNINYFPFLMQNNSYSSASFNQIHSNTIWDLNLQVGIPYFHAIDEAYPVILVSGTQKFDLFDYTKLDSDGNDLPDAALSWSCVQDNNSGLIWEVKTSANIDDKYTMDGTQGDASVYVKQVNDTTLCGNTNWRMPVVDELISIVNYQEHDPSVSKNYFPFTSSSDYWSATFFANSDEYIWSVGFLEGLYGNSVNSLSTQSVRVRLVSGGRSSVSVLPAMILLLD